jgi:hypothetical protein
VFDSSVAGTDGVAGDGEDGAGATALAGWTLSSRFGSDVARCSGAEGGCSGVGGLLRDGVSPELLSGGASPAVTATTAGATGWFGLEARWGSATACATESRPSAAFGGGVSAAEPLRCPDELTMASPIASTTAPPIHGMTEIARTETDDSFVGCLTISQLPLTRGEWEWPPRTIILPQPRRSVKRLRPPRISCHRCQRRRTMRPCKAYSRNRRNPDSCAHAQRVASGSHLNRRKLNSIRPTATFGASGASFVAMRQPLRRCYRRA